MSWQKFQTVKNTDEVKEKRWAVNGKGWPFVDPEPNKGGATSSV
jgi:hypothetical protein